MTSAHQEVVDLDESFYRDEALNATLVRNLDTGEVMTLSQLAETSQWRGVHPREGPAEILCCGYLWKRGHKLGQLVRRWYILQQSVGLYYFPSAQESVHAPESRRVVDIQGAHCVLRPPEAMHGLLAGTVLFGITIHFGQDDGRNRMLFAEHPEEQSLWGVALAQQISFSQPRVPSGLDQAAEPLGVSPSESTEVLTGVNVFTAWYQKARSRGSSFVASTPPKQAHTYGDERTENAQSVDNARREGGSPATACVCAAGDVAAGVAASAAAGALAGVVAAAAAGPSAMVASVAGVAPATAAAPHGSSPSHGGLISSLFGANGRSARSGSSHAPVHQLGEDLGASCVVSWV